MGKQKEIIVNHSNRPCFSVRFACNLSPIEFGERKEELLQVLKDKWQFEYFFQDHREFAGADVPDSQPHRTDDGQWIYFVNFFLK